MVACESKDVKKHRIIYRLPSTRKNKTEAMKDFFKLVKPARECTALDRVHPSTEFKNATFNAHDVENGRIL